MVGSHEVGRPKQLREGTSEGSEKRQSGTQHQPQSVAAAEAGAGANQNAVVCAHGRRASSPLSAAAGCVGTAAVGAGRAETLPMGDSGPSPLCPRPGRFSGTVCVSWPWSRLLDGCLRPLRALGSRGSEVVVPWSRRPGQGRRGSALLCGVQATPRHHVPSQVSCT